MKSSYVLLAAITAVAVAGCSSSSDGASETPHCGDPGLSQADHAKYCPPPTTGSTVPADTKGSVTRKNGRRLMYRDGAVVRLATVQRIPNLRCYEAMRTSTCILFQFRFSNQGTAPIEFNHGGQPYILRVFYGASQHEAPNAGIVGDPGLPDLPGQVKHGAAVLIGKVCDIPNSQLDTLAVQFVGTFFPATYASHTFTHVRTLLH